VLDPIEKPSWDHIDTVLLDVDGTLLDLAFDLDFWLDVIPAAYAASQSITLEQARALLAPRFRACEGTLPWYCIDHWTRELGLNVEALKRGHAAGWSKVAAAPGGAAPRVAWLPGAENFLQRCRVRGKRIVLLTNAHPTVLRIKDEQVGITRYVDAVFSSHMFGVPKENSHFWEAIRTVEPFDPDRALFADDTPAVVRAARAAGIRWVYGVRRPCIARPGGLREHGEVPAVDSVSDLDPVLL
jgi:FMN phosphatase YigB (HAD superfamily)